MMKTTTETKMDRVNQLREMPWIEFDIQRFAEPAPAGPADLPATPTDAASPVVPPAPLTQEQLQAARAVLEPVMRQEMYGETLGRVLNREAGVKTLKELEDLIAAGRTVIATGTAPAPAQPADDKVPPAIKAQLDARTAALDAREAAVNQRLAEAQAAVIRESLANAYREAGGLPNGDKAKPATQAMQMMMAEGMFEVGTDGVPVPKAGGSLKEAVGYWLSLNPHFRTQAPPPGGAPPPTSGNPAPPAPAKVDEMRAIGGFLG